MCWRSIVTYIVAFLIRDKSIAFQIGFSLFILLGIDLAYRYFPVEGFNHPWVNFENLGAWTNNKIEGVTKASDGLPSILYPLRHILSGACYAEKY